MGCLGADGREFMAGKSALWLATLTLHVITCLHASSLLPPLAWPFLLSLPDAVLDQHVEHPLTSLADNVTLLVEPSPLNTPPPTMTISLGLKPTLKLRV